MSNRTAELEQRGAHERAGSGGDGDFAPKPFVKWPQQESETQYAYVEGEITDWWEAKYGPVATMMVHRALDVRGELREEGEIERMDIGVDMEVNVPLNKTLQEKLSESDKGSVFHIAYEGWAKSKDGTRSYRILKVYEVPPQPASAQASEAPGVPLPEEDLPPVPQTQESGPGHPDADLPF